MKFSRQIVGVFAAVALLASIYSLATAPSPAPMIPNFVTVTPWVHEYFNVDSRFSESYTVSGGGHYCYIAVSRNGDELMLSATGSTPGYPEFYTTAWVVRGRIQERTQTDEVQIGDFLSEREASGAYDAFAVHCQTSAALLPARIRKMFRGCYDIS